MGSTADISLKQIIQRRIVYCQNDNNQELQFVNETNNGKNSRFDDDFENKIFGNDDALDKNVISDSGHTMLNKLVAGGGV